MPTKSHRVLAFVPGNEISPDRPYTILAASAGLNAIKLSVVETDGIHRPESIRNTGVAGKGPLRLIWRSENLNVGVTEKCSVRRRIPDAVAIRDACNLIHAIKNKKKKVTLEDIQSVTDPALKRELIQAICLSTL